MSETWVFNDDISYGTNITTYSINFISNSVSYTSLSQGYSDDDNVHGFIQYGDTIVWRTRWGIHWADTANKTVTFATSPTGALLTWLKANATQISVATDYDLENLDLPLGSYTIVSKAAAQGYTTSNNSNSVTYNLSLDGEWLLHDTITQPSFTWTEGYSNSNIDCIVLSPNNTSYYLQLIYPCTNITKSGNLLYFFRSAGTDGSGLCSDRYGYSGGKISTRMNYIVVDNSTERASSATAAKQMAHWLQQNADLQTITTVTAGIGSTGMVGPDSSSHSVYFKVNSDTCSPTNYDGCSTSSGYSGSTSFTNVTKIAFYCDVAINDIAYLTWNGIVLGNSINSSGGVTVVTNLPKALNKIEVNYFIKVCIEEHENIELYDGTIKCAKDIVAGDLLLGANGKISKVISNTFTYNRSDCYKIYFSNDDNVILTKDHVQLMNDLSTKPVKDLVIGDIVYKDLTIVNIEQLTDEYTTCNIDVDNDDTYRIRGTLYTHNY